MFQILALALWFWVFFFFNFCSWQLSKFSFTFALIAILRSDCTLCLFFGNGYMTCWKELEMKKAQNCFNNGFWNLSLDTKENLHCCVNHIFRSIFFNLFICTYFYSSFEDGSILDVNLQQDKIPLALLHSKRSINRTIF